MQIAPGCFSNIPFNAFRSLLPPVSPAKTSIAYDPDASLWILQQGSPAIGQSHYFASHDGKDFRELLEVEFRATADMRSIGFEAIGFGRLRLEQSQERAKLLMETDAGEIVLAAALKPLDRVAAQDLLLKGAYYLIQDQILYDRIEQGDANAILNYDRTCLLRFGSPKEVTRKAMNALIQQARDDDRAFRALCALTGSNFVFGEMRATAKKANEALEEYESDRFADAACDIDGARRILWQRIRVGDSEADRVLAQAAARVEGALDDLLLQFSRSEKSLGAWVLRAFPIAEQSLTPSRLALFEHIGHEKAVQLLQTMDPEPYVTGARANRWANDIQNCPEVAELGILAHFGNQKAREGLLELYASGHLPSREIILMLIALRDLPRSTVTEVPLAPLALKALTDPRAVRALSYFSEDGHPDALKLLSELHPIQALVEQATTDCDAVRALSLLDRAGNALVRTIVNQVSIEKWSRDIAWKGEETLEKFEGQEAMRLLAELGNQAATWYAAHVVPFKQEHSKPTEGQRSGQLFTHCSPTDERVSSCGDGREGDATDDTEKRGH